MTGKKSKSSLSRRFSFSTVGVVTFILLLFSVIAIIYSTVQINEKLRDRLENVSAIAGTSLPSALWNFERDTIKDIIDALSKEQEVVYFRLSDETRVYYENKAPEFREKNFPFFGKSSQFVTKVSEINFKGKKIGMIELAISKRSYQQELQVSIISIIVLAVVIAIAISLTSIVITKKHIFSPLGKLRDSATRIADGDLKTKIDTRSDNEIGTLAKAFDNMRQSIKNLFEELDHLVEERTADLHKSEQKLKMIIDKLRRRVYWIDINGVVEGGNQALADALKLSKPEDLKGLTEADMWKREEVVQLFRSLTQESIDKKAIQTNVMELIIDNSGIKRWLRIDCSPLEDENGNVTSVLVTYRDITDEKEREDELKKARDEAERANKAKDNFLANVSHEIRTPMNSIMGFTKQALKTRLTPEQKNYLTRVNSSVNDLKLIINDILDYSKMESGELEIPYMEFQLEDALEGVMNNFKELANSKGIRLILEKEAKVPGALMGDDLRLKQILNNLMSNAIKFTEAGSVSLKVSCIDKDKRKVSILFAVKDTGIGISPENTEKIFHPYEQLKSSVGSVTKGIGLGLTISKRLVELMKGKIRVESEVGKGSTFYVHIAFDRISEDKPAKEFRSEDLVKKTDLRILKGLHVLSVEDDECSQVLIEDILSKEGMTVDKVENGIEALKMVRNNVYDIVLMDIEIPGINGYEVSRMIRKEQRFANLPIVAVTAHAMVGERKKCMDYGMNDHIPKPIDADDLLKSIAKWIPKNRIENNIENKGTTSNQLMQSGKFDEKKIIESLVGLDVNGALRRLKVDLSTYIKSLKAFAQNHANTIADIIYALDAKNINEVRLLLHTLKGASANLAANEVEANAKKLHTAVKMGKRNLKALIDNLDSALKIVLNSIETAKTFICRAETNTPGKDIPNELTDLESLFGRLVKLLSEHDFEVTKVMDEATPYLAPLVDREDMKNLQDQMLILDFKGALKTLKAIANRIGIYL
jgi:PAS domain S-box-containing protein